MLMCMQLGHTHTLCIFHGPLTSKQGRFGPRPAGSHLGGKLQALFPELALTLTHAQRAALFKMQSHGHQEPSWGEAQWKKCRRSKPGSRTESRKYVFCLVLLNFIITFLGTAIILMEFKMIEERNSDLLLLSPVFKFLNRRREREQNNHKWLLIPNVYL